MQPQEITPKGPATVPIERIDAASQTLKDLVRDSGYRAAELPSFAKPPPPEAPSWLEKLTDFINSLLSRLFSKKSSSLDGLLSPEVVKATLIGLLAFFLAVLLFWLVRKLIFRTRNEKPRATGSSDPKFEDPESHFKIAIDQALKSQRFAHASRLRWRLFLFRKAQPSSLTPYEHTRGAPRSKLSPEQLARQYELMFADRAAAEPSSLAAYEACSSALSMIETDMIETDTPSIQPEMTE